MITNTHDSVELWDTRRHRDDLCVVCTVEFIVVSDI